MKKYEKLTIFVVISFFITWYNMENGNYEPIAPEYETYTSVFIFSFFGTLTGIIIMYFIIKLLIKAISNIIKLNKN